MREAILAAGLAGLLAACNTFAGTVPGDPARDNFGVSTHQPSQGDSGAVDQPSVRALNWQLAQICTLGHETVTQDIDSAERDEQLVDWQTRCSSYRLSILGLSLAGIVPQPKLLGGTGR